MKTIYLFMVALTMLATPTLFAVGGSLDYKPLSQQDLSAYYNQLETQVDQTQQQLHDLVVQGSALPQPGSTADPDLPKKVEQLAQMVNVKEALVSEFEGKSSLRSPLVRQALLEVVSKDTITPDDLTQLQQIVNSEKTNIQAFDASQKAPK